MKLTESQTATIKLLVAHYKAKNASLGNYESYEGNSRQKALYAFLERNGFTKENPATQKDIINGVGRMADGAFKPYYESCPSQFNKDLCRTIYTDVDSLNKSDKWSFKIVKGDNYTYWLAGTFEDIDASLKEYSSKICAAADRWVSLNDCKSRSGQGKTLSNTYEPHELTKDCEKFVKPMKTEYEQLSIGEEIIGGTK